MIAIIRKQDNLVVNDRQGCDFQHLRRWQALQAQIDAELDPAVKHELQDLEIRLRSQHDEFIRRRIVAILPRFGGNEQDFTFYRVPKEDERAFFSATRITFDGERLNYEQNPPYQLAGSTVTVFPRWVVGNFALTAPDVTDFSQLIPHEEPLAFALVYFQSVITQEISVKLFTWEMDETPQPFDLTNHINRGVVCQGMISPDNTITIA